MNKIEIKNRFNGDVIYSYECENNTLKITCMNAVLDKINLSYVDLSGANLSYVDLSYANLSYANLSGANLSRANLGYVDLSYANLSGANLSRANLGYANLSRANLSYVDLSRANLSYVDLSGANLSRANLGYVDLSGAAIVIYGMMWPIQITKNHIKIGCQSHTLDDWADFDDDKISKMHDNAIEFWKENKDFIINKCKELSK